MDTSSEQKPKKVRKSLILIGSALLIILLFVTIFYTTRNNSSTTKNNNDSKSTATITPTEDPYYTYYREIFTSLSEQDAIIQPTLLPNETSTFYRAYNLGGRELTIDNHLWRDGKTVREEFELDGDSLLDDYSDVNFESQIKDPARLEMMKDFIWHGGRPVARVKMNSIDKGKYWVFFYVYEETAPTDMNIYLNRKIVAKNLSSGKKGSWTKFGPLAVTVTDGSVEMISTGGDVNFTGIELYKLENK